MQRITVALGFNDQVNRTLVGAGVALARLMKLDLHLIHAFFSDADMGRPLASRLFPDATSAMASNGFDDGVRGLELARLAGFAESVDSSICVTTQLFEGDAAVFVLEQAKPEATKLLIVGINEHYSKLMPPEFSVALKALRNCLVPVLAIPFGDRSINFDKPVFLVADDLRNSESLLQGSIDLLRDLGGGTLIDAHIKTGMLQVVMRKLQSKVDIDLLTPKKKSEIYGRALIKKKMNQNLESIRAKTEIIDKTIKFKSLIVPGKFIPTMRQTISRTNADFLVVGRHRFFHIADCSFGEYSFRNTGVFRIPVLLTPVQ